MIIQAYLYIHGTEFKIHIGGAVEGSQTPLGQLIALTHKKTVTHALRDQLAPILAQLPNGANINKWLRRHMDQTLIVHSAWSDLIALRDLPPDFNLTTPVAGFMVIHGINADDFRRMLDEHRPFPVLDTERITLKKPLFNQSK